MSIFLHHQECFNAHIHRDKDETHHHSQAEAGNGDNMEVALRVMSAVKIRLSSHQAYPKLLLLAHTAHV
jgi:hypothetical protein